LWSYKKGEKHGFRNCFIDNVNIKFFFSFIIIFKEIKLFYKKTGGIIK